MSVLYMRVVHACCTCVLYMRVVQSVLYMQFSKSLQRTKWAIIMRPVSTESTPWRLFIKPGIQERGTECGECGEWAFRGMLKKIPGNVQKDSGECSTRFRGMFKKILGNAQQDSGECSPGFRGMLKKIPGNVPKDSGECSKRFRGMFGKIPGNVRKDSGECSKRFRGMLAKILENAQKDWTIYNAIKPK